MGNIHIPPLSILAERLIADCGLTEFVETGTFQGSTLPWAASRFRRVRTIEIRADYQEQARQRVGNLPNVEFLLGDSGVVLREVCQTLAGPALFWLDAHAGAGFFGPDDDCPLLSEVDAVVDSPFDHCIFIDDARAFLAPPPPPFDYRKWPSLDEVMAVLSRRTDILVVTINDSLIAVPRRMREVVANYCAAVRPKI
jgi:hypothetical protein